MRSRTPLEYALMCLIARAPTTGNELVRLLREYPLAASGQSPGAVYPALHRLADAGLVKSRRRPRSEADAMSRQNAGSRLAGVGRPTPGVRRFREHGLTGKGVASLREWALRPVTRAEVLGRPDHLLLRFSFVVGLAGGTAARRFAAQYRRVAEGLTVDMAHALNEARAEASPSARLAMELSLRLLEVRVAWAAQAAVELADFAARNPHLDDTGSARAVRSVVEGLPPHVRAAIRWPRLDGPHRAPRAPRPRARSP